MQGKVLTADEARRIAITRGCPSCWGRAELTKGSQEAGVL
jgi:hypothetical protein